MISMTNKQMKKLLSAKKVLEETQTAVMAEYLDNYGRGETEADTDTQEYLILLQNTINNLQELLPPWEIE